MCICIHMYVLLKPENLEPYCFSTEDVCPTCCDQVNLFAFPPCSCCPDSRPEHNQTKINCSVAPVGGEIFATCGDKWYDSRKVGQTLTPSSSSEGRPDSAY